MSVLVVGVQQHALFILAHESAHYRLFRSRLVNDAVGRVIGMSGGISMCTYRVIHRLHHNNLYTEEDPDTAIHGGYPRGVAYLWKKLAQDLAGLNSWKTFAYFFGSPAINAETNRAARPLDDTSPALRASARADRWAVVGFHVVAPLVAYGLGGGDCAAPVSGVVAAAAADGAAADPAAAGDRGARCGDRPVVAADGGALQSHHRVDRQSRRPGAALSPPRQLSPRAPPVPGGAALPPARAASPAAGEGTCSRGPRSATWRTRCTSCSRPARPAHPSGAPRPGDRG